MEATLNMEWMQLKDMINFMHIAKEGKQMNFDLKIIMETPIPKR